MTEAPGTAGAPHGEHPLVVDSRRLPRQPGASLSLTAEVEPDADLANDVVRIVAEPTPVELLLESVLDGILVTGRADLRLSGECVRCLDPLDTTIEVTFRPFFTYPGAQPPEPGAEPDDDIIEMTGPLLDLRPAFRDAAVLALPLTPTCRPDCPGLCSRCGARLADDPNHGHDELDPRLAVLADLQARSVAPGDTPPDSRGD